MADTQVRKSYCRTCQAFCGVEVEVADGRLVRIRGDSADPVSHGFVCSKGLQAPELHHGEGRLLRPLKRAGEGGWEPIASETALAEIGARLGEILQAHGPDAVAVYGGTQSLFDAVTPLATRGFAAALGVSYYGTMTIDQSAKWLAEARCGTFGGGPQPFDTADVWMLVGSNPLVSMVAAGGPTQFGFHDPVRALRRARARGLKLIVVDPRGSETARQADLFLQPYPGEDAALMAGLLHIVLGEGWEDADFCRRYLQPLGPLRAALAPFTPAKVAARTGVEEEHLRRAASLFARDSRRGMAGSGTGPDMGPHSNLAEHLIQVLNLVCGRFLREGELVPNPGVLGPRIPRRAQPVAGVREWETSRRSRAGGLGSIRGEMMSARLADEILSPGEDRIRALICVGGNPAVALPDQVKAVAALRSLELFVAVDPRLSASARLAHYVLPPLLPYERPDQTSFLERFFRTPYAQFTPALVAPPSDSDLVDDWYVFWRLAAELGISLQIGGVALPTARPPDRMELLALLARKAQVPYEAVRATAGGRIHDVPPQVVEAGDPATPPLDVMPSDVASELRGLAGDADPGRGGFRLIVRRQRSLMNSTLSDAPAVRARLPQNPLYMHLDDMSALGVGQGDLVVVTRGPGRRIRAPVCADPQLRRGVVALSHGWGPPASGPGPLGGIELATNLLVDDELGVEAINAMPVMTAIPVTVEPLGDSS